MAVYGSPGVYISEKDYSEYLVSSSTCIVGIVGEARRGPIGVPTLVSSQSELISTFGEPISGCYGIYSALQVLTQASTVYYTRVVRSATNATAGKADVDPILYTAVIAGTEGNGIEVEQTAPEEGVFSITVTCGDLIEAYEDLSITEGDDAYFVTKINSVSQLIQVKDNQAEVHFGEEANEYTLSGAMDTASKATAGTKGTDILTFVTTNSDSTLNGGKVEISDPDDYGYFTVVIYEKVSDTEFNEIETWEAVTLDKNDDRYAPYVINTGSKRVIVNYDDTVTGTLEGETLFFTETADDGSSGISDADIIGEKDGTGIMSFSNTEMISIDVLIVPGATSPAVIQKALDMCATRGDTIFVADTPFGYNAQRVTDWANGTGEFAGDHPAFNSSYGAFYWPWIQVSDSYSKGNIWLPPSGFIAAQYAYNDIQSFPWYAPAGLNRGLIQNALALEKSPTKGERDLVYGNRNIINPIANVLGQGLVIWGQKTMQRKPTALDRVNVRRCINYLERSIGDSLKYYVFEQNTPATWDRAKTLINPILANAKANNGINEYKIIIKPTSEDIKNSRMPVVVYIKPTKTSEYIPLTFNVMPYDASFSDIY